MSEYLREELAFQKALDANRADVVTRLAYADWLEEHYRPEESYAQRWMVSWKKWPCKRRRNHDLQRMTKKWIWCYDYPDRDEAQVEEVCLPPTVFLATSGRNPFKGFFSIILYSTASDAEAALVRGLVRLQRQIELKK